MGTLIEKKRVSYPSKVVSAIKISLGLIMVDIDEVGVNCFHHHARWTWLSTRIESRYCINQKPEGAVEHPVHNKVWIG
jgi:hypothetical protein